MEVATHLRADGADDFQHEARAIFERPAVFVLAVVDRGAEELGDEIAVGAVQLDAVESRLARPARSLGKRCHRLADLRLRHRLAAEPVDRVGLRRSS